MVLQASGPIKFSQLQNEFNSTGTGAIKFSNYYRNATANYTVGINGIPNIGSSISVSYFYGKSSLPIITVNNIVKAWNTQNSVITYIFDDTTNNNIITFTKNTYCELLLVGGGSGFTIPDYQSAGGAGGGGGGGIYYDPKFMFLIGTYNIIIGKPGGVSSLTYSQANGTDTYISSNNSLYGTYKGLGGTYNNLYNTDGGGPTYTYIASIDANSIKTINSYIYNGQSEYNNLGLSDYQQGLYSGGGSGAGGSAGASSTVTRNGGPGYTSSITGLSITYAGGGEGAGPPGANYLYSPGNGATNYGGGATDYPRYNSIKGCAIIKFLNN
jgi:hypothetical protein